MRYEIILAPEAIQDLKRLSVRDRSMVRDELETHLRFEPDKLSRNRIKRLRGIRRPQYRLRVGEIRGFYDIVQDVVEVLAIVKKSDAMAWLAEMGEVE
ncbi:MAG: type II toxin-antitoxin system RelE/ParE family toxin [Anaerolineae bacterium]|nr:type II toxin-antitoxin system RelE/ParE family toxin [Anaerolineae bacterium]